MSAVRAGLAVLLILTLIGLTANATPPIAPEETVKQILIPYLQRDTRALVLFAAELNISNGDPATKAFGERYMFGRLVNAHTALDPEMYYEDHGDEIIAEIERLLLGPWENNGRTEMTFRQVGKGRALSLTSGKWERTPGGIVIRVAHTTEYANIQRVAYLIQHGERGGCPIITIYRKGQ